ncbi:GMP/IMP nucleotidase [Serratia fonticola]|uniref:GMP/IMP nucleotidase n=1 Tax=Serratia fonticola TaxID=47917 RepID=A0A4U9WQU5_SERFO|nr:GMP/IMP nucleotidase [Serratia fonticola]
MVPEFDWHDIDTVLLDMDGTLLDLEFDSHFWLTLVPQALSEQRAIPFDDASKNHSPGIPGRATHHELVLL